METGTKKHLIIHRKGFSPKVNYIPARPVRWALNSQYCGLVDDAEDYKYSSTKFYVIGLGDFEIVTHYKGD